MLGVDTTTAIRDVAGMKADGYAAVFRYLSNSPAKNLIMSAAPWDTELRRYLDGGVAVVFNWEATGKLTTSNHPGDPAGQGHEDASRAADQAARMGHPEAPIYFSIDYDCSDWGSLDHYFRGVATVIPLSRIGVYGGYWVVDHLLHAGLVTYAWQTLAWSSVNGAGHTRHPRANVIQRVGEVNVRGSACDVDEIVTPADFGQLPRPAVTGVPAPTGAAALPTITDGVTSPLVWQLQRFLNDTFPAYSKITVGSGPTSRCGPQTEAVITEFQRRSGIPAGAPFAVGEHTWQALLDLGFRPS